MNYYDKGEFSETRWLNRGWSCVKVDPDGDIVAMVKWLHRHDREDAHNQEWRYLRQDLFVIKDPKLAMMFKLTWGGHA